MKEKSDPNQRFTRKEWVDLVMSNNKPNLRKINHTNVMEIKNESFFNF